MNKERILRDIEYVNGGITAIKALFESNKERNAPFYMVFDEWQDILCSIIDMIEEDYEDAKNTRGTC